ncbi:MAG: Fe-S-containing protein, partial [Candidatus Hodarchaeota archaeon]
EGPPDEGWKINGIFVILIIVAGFVATLFLLGSFGSFGNQDTYQPKQVGDEIHIDLAKLNTNALFFTFDSNGVSIQYFAVIGSDENSHIAFDVCDVCYQERKGYSQRNNAMYCNNCGQEFAINSIGTENIEGGCWPSYLPVSQSAVGDKLIVAIADLEAKRSMFS